MVNIAVFAVFQQADAEKLGIHGKLGYVRLPDRGKSGKVGGKNGKGCGNRGKRSGNVFAASPAEGPVERSRCVHCARLSPYPFARPTHRKNFYSSSIAHDGEA
jgi:hypothetical protein